jgi:hypothetical protein
MARPLDGQADGHMYGHIMPEEHSAELIRSYEPLLILPNSPQI